MNRVAVIVIGDGPELPVIQAKAQSLGIANRCIFLESVPNHEIQQFYAVSDIFLHPTYNEGFPRVVLEAMAAGLPIISTDAGGTLQLMGELQSSLVVPRDEPQAFAFCLEKIIADSSLRLGLSIENRGHVDCFSTTNIAAMCDEFLFK